MKKIPNPNGNKFVLPKGYTDLGWQLDFNASELKKMQGSRAYPAEVR